eukprot:TRINITY_DN16689_c0_g1_i2.p1 TRINITY_DN16689_c0_g1~~TRINITY_DN16689_c0_g1_i2.p1  ORF type:complete len:142 (-),score=17.59 TRINITY_DN16689_c0_g1_i2:122-547(-)
MPGLTESADVSQVLNSESRSWFSYNLPYFPSISTAGGYANVTDPEDSYQNCTRAKMYRRAMQHRDIKSLSSFVDFMRYVNQSDPLSGGDGCRAISARCDLNPHGQLFGAQDIKVASSSYNKDGLGFFSTLSPSWDLSLIHI